MKSGTSALMRPSATARVLAVPELLDNVFSFLARHDAAHASQVSRDWVEIGRDHVWRVVHTPCQLFSILSPIEHDPQYGHIFAESVTEKSLSHFLLITRRVRELYSLSSQDECDKTDNDIMLAFNEEFFSQLNMTLHSRQQLLFPRLATLRWWDSYVSPSKWPWFGSTMLNDISLISPHCCSEKDLIHFLPTLVPSTETITFVTSPENEERSFAVEVETVDAGWPQFFKDLDKLKYLFFPVNFVTSPVFAQASTSSSLTHLKFFAPTDPRAIVRNRRNITHFPHPSLEPGCFPALRNLELAIPLSAAINLVRDDNFPAPQLEELGLRAVHAEPESIVRSAIAELAKLAGLHILRLQLASHRSYDEPEEYSQELEDCYSERAEDGNRALSLLWSSGCTPLLSERLCAATLSSLHGAHLFLLDIAHRHSIHINDDDLVELVQALPELFILSLNPAPVCIGKATLTLAVLDRLAGIRPSLEIVRLYIDATLNDDEDIPSPTNQFEWTVRSLWLNASPIAESEDKQRKIASYLRLLLPDGINLDTGTLGGAGGSKMYFWDHVPPVNVDYSERWRRVADMVEELRDVDDEDESVLEPTPNVEKVE
ncbi:hypothetical protein PENSPDRAFT_738855 [Peniophora sp. CONT]|nr:hypothetical protein PENSPDRAFT_738855 [Peniophora sp. CONT]